MGVDERVLGAGTGLRFVLLMVLFLTSSATVTNKIVESVADPRNIRVGCALAAGANPDSDYLGIALTTVRAGDAYQRCLDRFVPSAAGWVPVVVLGALLVAAAGLYWMLPRWKGRRGRVVPVDGSLVGGPAAGPGAERPAPQGELRAVLDELVEVAGLSGRPPRFVIAPAEVTAGAVVFGRLRRYAVCLHGGLVARRGQDPEGFRAVVLHELAHIRNRDVDVTYATVALWRVFLVAVMPAYLVWIALDLRSSAMSAVLGPAERIGMAHELVLSAAMIAFVHLARADVLRTRETYADLDALAWGADAGAWRDPGSPRASRSRRLWGSFAALWRTHPPWDRRVASLSDPRELFAPHAGTLFVAGATSTIVGDQMADLLPGVRQGWVLGPLTALLAGLIAAIPGLALWRGVARAVLTGGRVPSGLRAGWWLGVGLVVGELLMSTTSGSTRWLPRHPEAFALLLVMSVGILCWTAQYAELSVRSWRGRTLRPAMLLGLAATWAVFALWYAWWQADGHVLTMGWAYSGSGIREALEHDLPGTVPGHEGALSAIAMALPLLLPIGTDPMMLWAAALLWLLPLLAWVRRRSAAGAAPRWVRSALRGASGPARGPAAVLPSLRRPLYAAGVGGLVCWAGIVAVMASMHTWQPPVDRRYGTYLLVFLASALIVLVGGTAATAAVTAALTGRFSLLLALVAAGTTALLGLAGLFLLGSFDGCLGPLNTLRSTCHWQPDAIWSTTEILLPLVLGLGLFVSAAAALLGMAARRVGRRALRRDRPTAGNVNSVGKKPKRRWGRPGPRREKVVARRVWVGVTCGAVLALNATVSLPSGDGGRPGRASLTKEQLVPRDAIPAASPQVLGAQTDAWLRLGGRNLTGRFGAAVLGIVTALQDKSALTDRGFAARRIRPHCVAVEQVVSEAGRYLPLPDPWAQQRWARLQRRGEQAGADCRRAIVEGRFPVFTKAMRDFLDIGRATTELLDVIAAQAAPGRGTHAAPGRPPAAGGPAQPSSGTPNRTAGAAGAP
ncbi:M48 family metalloprotease [Streptomyces endophytica]|uniref:M48 family metalloprotease n=1 Tax=Streptomyces endophytica TaxID=2991496 RepID=A0ABY6PGA5_9ACTN|nr:M48 family metalloprotease [Streptomyces endophytica]UZJ32826.1 M48 family metalloprotease [Streptomyces endophytica]